MLSWALLSSRAVTLRKVKRLGNPRERDEKHSRSMFLRTLVGESGRRI